MAQGSLGVLFNSLQGKSGSVVFVKTKDGTLSARASRLATPKRLRS